MRILIAAIVFLFVVDARESRAQGVSWGLKAGATASALETDGAGAFDTAPRAGAAIGTFVSWQFDRVRLQPELYFASRRFVTTDTAFRIAARSSSFELPILIDVAALRRNPVSIHVFAGPQFNVIKRVEQTFNGQTVEITNDFVNVDAGATVGAALEIARGSRALTIDARTNIGLRDLSHTGPPALRSRALLVLAGLRF